MKRAIYKSLECHYLAGNNTAKSVEEKKRPAQTNREMKG